jgi:hypothetical protein
VNGIICCNYSLPAMQPLSLCCGGTWHRQFERIFLMHQLLHLIHSVNPSLATDRSKPLRYAEDSLSASSGLPRHQL